METELQPTPSDSPLPETETATATEITEEPEPQMAQEPQLPETPQPSGPTQEEISQMVADAEQRGYLRARNEMAESFMARPELFENPLRRRERHETAARSLADNFLSELPRGVWD